MIIVRLKVNTRTTAQYYKDKAIGTIDSYGNPFRIIKLKWNATYLHRNAEYAKTRGFEDAVIGRNEETGDYKITYRRNGSISWSRPDGHIGKFEGELAVTPHNINKLVSHYGDKLWFIEDADIDAKVKLMYEKRIAEMSKETKEFNSIRLQKMHTADTEYKRDAKLEIPVDPSFDNEKQRKLTIKETDLDKRAAELAAKEKELAEKEKALVNAGAALSGYSKNYLMNQTIAVLRRHCRELGADFEMSHKKGDLVEIILDKQSGGIGKPVSEIIPENEESSETEPDNISDSLDG
jgi:hypothetical protein